MQALGAPVRELKKGRQKHKQIDIVMANSCFIDNIMEEEHRRRLIILIILRRRLQRKIERSKNKKRYKINDVLKERRLKGEFYLLVNQVRYFYPEQFFQMFRMYPSKFESLLGLVAPLLLRDPTKADIIPPDERLCVTLRYLATGDAFKTIASSYRVSDTTVGRIIPETCNALWTVLLQNGFLKAPETVNEWKSISEEFEQRWNFPNCLGAIDGKHVIVQCPPRSGSMYFNYKKFHSIVLMATVNANYEFIMVDIGNYGRLSDGSVFASSTFGIALNNGHLNLPPPRRLDNSGTLYPYVFIADDAFPLKPNLMKPFPGDHLSTIKRVANYRFCRARRIVENAFGIATSRWRVFRKPICAGVETAISVTKAVVALHNYLMKRRVSEGRSVYFPSTLIDCDVDGYIRRGAWRNELFNQALLQIGNIGSNNHSIIAKEVRDNFAKYFSSNEGSIPWQWDVVQRAPYSFDTIN